jgi:hypothetical protein
MKSQGKNVRRIVIGACMFALAFASLAFAVERPEYKEQVEPICKKNKEESEKFLKGVKTLVKKNKLKQAGTAFSKAASALEKAEKQLAAVPQPAADEARLGKWLTDIKGEVALMKQIAAKFKAGNKSKGSSLSVKLTRNADTANSQVTVLGFNYCKIDPSKFS